MLPHLFKSEVVLILTASRSVEKTRKAEDLLKSFTKSDHPNNNNNNIIIIECDVGQEDSVKKFFDTIITKVDRIDYVIHSAGISPNTDFLEQTQQEWDQVLNTNTTSSFLVVKYAAIAMRQINNNNNNKKYKKVLLIVGGRSC